MVLFDNFFFCILNCSVEWSSYFYFCNFVVMIVELLFFYLMYYVGDKGYFSDIEMMGFILLD